MMAQKIDPGSTQSKPERPAPRPTRRAGSITSTARSPQLPAWLGQRLPVLLLGIVLLIALLIAWRLRGGQSDLAGTWRGEGPTGAALTLSLDGSGDSLSGSLSILKAPKSPYLAAAHRQIDGTLTVAFPTPLPNPFSGGWICTLEDAANLSCADGIRQSGRADQGSAPPPLSTAVGHAQPCHA